MCKVRSRSIYIAFVVALAALCWLSLVLSPRVAFAEESADSFEVVFPTESYFQSQDPTLVAANADYLAVYDRAQKRLYVRSNTRSTYFYDISDIFGADDALSSEDSAGDLPQKTISDIFAIGHHVFIVASEPSGSGTSTKLELYSIDAQDPASVPTLREAPTPKRIYSFASDGERLYAKNAAGNLSIYDEDLNPLREDIYNDLLAGMASFAGNGDNIYLFPTNQSVPMLSIYDSKDDKELLTTRSKLVSKAYIGDVIFAQISPAEEIENHSKIVCLDKVTGVEIYTSDFMPSSFCAYGDRLYSINDDSVTVYRLTLRENEYVLLPEEIITMAGGDLYHLDHPSDIVVSEGAIVVADSQNNRIAAIDSTAQKLSVAHSDPLPSQPLRISGDKDGVFALLADGSVAYVNIVDGTPTVSRIFNEAGEEQLRIVDVLDMGERSYLLADDGLYGYFGELNVKLAAADGARRIAAANGGSAIYVLFDNEIAMFTLDGKKLPAKLTGDFADALDFAADYAGNIFLLYEDRIESYKNNVRSLEPISQTKLTSSVYRATANSCALFAGKLYFTTDECFVGAIDADCASDETYVPPIAPSPSEDTPYRFVKQKEGADSYFIPADDGRADGIIPANSNVLLLLEGVGELDEGLSYAMDEDKLYIIPTEDFEDVQPTALEHKAFLFKSEGAIYSIPYFDGLSVSVSQGEQGFWTVSDCAGYDSNKWWIVRHNGKNYFVRPENLEEDLAPPVEDDPEQNDPKPDAPPEKKATFGRAKASRVGGTVNIYSSISEDEVLTQIVDGKKVEILASLNGYYQVKFGDIIGFMRAKEVKIGGLTTVQIVAIVLSIVVLLAGTGIFFSIYSIKKRNDNEAEESNRSR